MHMSGRKLKISKFCSTTLFLLMFFVTSSLSEDQSDIHIIKQTYDVMPSKPSMESELRQTSEEKAQRYNEEAIRLFEQGRFEEAQLLWEKALEILDYPGLEVIMIDGIQKGGEGIREHKQFLMPEIDKTVSGGGQIEKKYQSSVFLFEDGRYVESQKLFEQIQQRMPNYKETQNYLKVLEDEIQKEGALTRKHEMEEWTKVLDESERERQRMLRKQAELIYQEALNDYKAFIISSYRHK